jgi:hypothetical protein
VLAAGRITVPYAVDRADPVSMLRQRAHCSVQVGCDAQSTWGCAAGACIELEREYATERTS